MDDPFYKQPLIDKFTKQQNYMYMWSLQHTLKKRTVSIDFLILSKRNYFSKNEYFQYNDFQCFFEKITKSIFMNTAAIFQYLLFSILKI